MSPYNTWWYPVFTSILLNTLHSLRWYMKSSMIGASTYLLLFIYLFGFLLSMLARIMFVYSLLRSLIAYLSLYWTTKGEYHVMASFPGTFSKIPPASPYSIHFLRVDSRYYGPCLSLWAIDCIPATISNPTSMTFPGFGSLQFPILWNLSLYPPINSFVDFGLFRLSV